MATDLTTIFGSEIVVSAQPRLSERQLTAYPGAHGLTGMWMGSRGYLIAITGRIRVDASGGYSAGRLLLDTAVAAIEQYLYAAEADYSFSGSTYSNAVLEKFDLINDRNGKSYHYVKGNYLIADFVAVMRALI